MFQRNSFVEALREPVASFQKPILARTENGMRARSTTSNANLDLFGSIGAMRGKDVVPAFAAAYAENKDYALRIAQWARDVRGGSGERQIYRDILLWLEKNDPKTLFESNLLRNLPEIGRFDDLFIFKTVDGQAHALSVFIDFLKSGNGLAAKWAPRKGQLAVILRRALGMSPKQYRRFVVRNTNVVEQQMCAKNWSEINYSHVPSVAMTRYLKAFKRNDPQGFEAWKAALTRKDGTAKVNAGAVYPYDVTALLGGAKDLSGGYGYSRGYGTFGRRGHFNYDQLPVAQGMWDALPDYMNGKNVLAVCDNSGSMQSPVAGKSTVSALDVAASLTMYTAQRSKGAFRDLSISFSDNAEWCRHRGDLIDRLTAVCSMSWGSTNLHSVFDLILNHAVSNRVPASDMPEMIVIFSDMQFNSCTRYDDSASQMIRRKYENAGYDMPNVVYWNLRATDNVPVKFNDAGVALVSGFSPSLMKSVLSADTDRLTPEGVMKATILNTRYNW